MSAMQLAVQDVLAALYQQRDNQEVWELFTLVGDAAEQATAEDGNWTLLALAEMLAHPQCPSPALLSCLCERGIAAGGDPGIALGLIVTRLYETLVQADQFLQACRYRVETSGNTDAEAVQQAVAGERPGDALGFAQLVLSCMGTTPLLNHFPDARQLFHSLPDSDTVLQRLIAVHPAVAELATTLAKHNDPPMTRDGYNEAVDAALAAIRAVPPLDEYALNQALAQLLRSVFCVELAVRNRALHGLAEIITTCDIGDVGTMAQLCGSFAEMGVDPLAALEALLARLPEVLALSGRFVTTCVTAARADGDPDCEPQACVEEHGEETAAELPLESVAMTAVGPYCLGVIALLSRARDKRKEVSRRSDLLPLASEVAPVVGPTSFLCKMLQVRDDEELIVLAPAEKLGWRVRIRGVADNFQLHTLLAGRVIGTHESGLYPGRVGTQDSNKTDPVPGIPLDARAVGVASVLPCRDRETSVWSYLQLLDYTALQPDGRLANESEHFIWNEGVPADIPAFGGTRIVLLTEASYLRSWSGGRIFRGMRGDLRIEETLDVTAVEGWLARIRTRGGA